MRRITCLRRPAEKNMSHPKIPDILSAYFEHPHAVICTEFNSGLTNFNFQVKDEPGKMFFLKIFRNANLLRIKSVATLINHLQHYRFPTPEIIPCLSGDYCWNDGKEGAIITRFIKGKYPENTEENLYRIGNILGALHQIPASAGLLQGYSLNYPELLKQVYNFDGVIEEEFSNFLVSINPVIGNIPLSGFPQSIIHGDIFLDNLLQTSLGDIYFIDFEGGCVDKSIFDIARSVIGCAMINQKFDLKLTKAILSGYTAVRDFEPIEQEYLYEFIIYAGAISVMWRYTEFNIRRPFENKKNLYKKLLIPTLNLIETGKRIFQDAIYSNQI